MASEPDVDPPPLTAAELAEAARVYLDMLTLERSGVREVVISLHRPYRVRPVGRPIASKAESLIISTTK